jgi:tRNA1(Val) A37 N6-methylase TrmN6
MRLLQNERLEELGIGGYGLIQNKTMFCFGVDAVLLSDFTKVKTGGRVLDLGCGNGIIPILLCAKTKAAQIVGLEIQKECARLAQRNVELNGLEQRISIQCGDIKTVSDYFEEQTFDAVVSNPPYMEPTRGFRSGSRAVEIARHEVLCDIFDVLEAASRMLKFGGKLFVIHRPARIADLIFSMRQNQMEPKRIRFAHPSPGKRPSMILVEGQKGARPGCIVESGLFIQDGFGKYTKEIMKIYQKED